MSLLDIAYASAPTDTVILPTLAITAPTAFEPIYICDGFEDHAATLETDEVVTFIATGMDIALPAKDTSGQQTLRWALDNVTGQAQQAVDAAIEAGERVTITYRSYLYPDLSAPAEVLRMTLLNGEFSGSTVQLEAGYYDLLNTAWPRLKYTATFAPGLKYFQ